MNMQLSSSSSSSNNPRDLQSTGSLLRSVVCDHRGVVIAQTVYRCMFCSSILDTLHDINRHCQVEHFEDEECEVEEDSLLNASAAATPAADVAVDPIDFENDNFNVDIYDDLGDCCYYYDEEMRCNGHQTPVMDRSAVAVASQRNGPQVDDDHNGGGCGGGGKLSGSVLVNGGGGNGGGGKVSTTTTTPNIKGGGYVTCEICGLTKYYSHLSRRYGVFSCESCAKFFYRYSQKPVPYICAADNKCPLNIDVPGARCKSCLLDACLKKYILDPKKYPKVFTKNGKFVATATTPTTAVAAVQGRNHQKRFTKLASNGGGGGGASPSAASNQSGQQQQRSSSTTTTPTKTTVPTLLNSVHFTSKNEQT